MVYLNPIKHLFVYKRTCVTRNYLINYEKLSINDSCGLSAEPERVHSLHCRPQSSTSISCSWAPPEADYDSYTIECLHQDSRRLVYSRRTGRDSSAYVITQLEPHKRYRVSVKVISAGVTSEEALDNVLTMIDRKSLPERLMQDV